MTKLKKSHITKIDETNSKMSKETISELVELSDNNVVDGRELYGIAESIKSDCTIHIIANRFDDDFISAPGVERRILIIPYKTKHDDKSELGMKVKNMLTDDTEYAAIINKYLVPIYKETLRDPSRLILQSIYDSPLDAKMLVSDWQDVIESDIFQRSGLNSNVKYYASCRIRLLFSDITSMLRKSAEGRLPTNIELSAYFEDLGYPVSRPKYNGKRVLAVTCNKLDRDDNGSNTSAQDMELNGQICVITPDYTIVRKDDYRV